MEEIVLFGIIFVAAIVLLPIISLIKLSAIDRRLSNLEKGINRLIEAKEKATPEVEKPIAAAPKVAEEYTPYSRPAKPEIIPEPEPVIPQDTLIIQEKEEGIIAEEPEITKIPEIEIPVFTTFGEPAKEPEKRKIPQKKKTLKKKTQGVKFENLLSKIGIITLVLGVGFFVKYAIDKDWINEIGRVGIGLLTGGVMIAIAHKLRQKYNLFSAIMVGGGISVLYITITLAFREYQLFTQPVAFGILIAITIFSVILSLLYDRKELALFSLLGGYASPLMISTGTGNYIVLFSFLVILNTGMLIISMRKKWNIVGIVSFFCTLLFYWVWLSTKFENEYTGALTFGVLFFVQFYLLALFDHFLSGKNISPFQVIIILTNNISLFAASIYIFNNTGLKIQGIITIAMAVINAIVMLLLFRRATIDKRLLYLIIAIVLSFVSLAIPVQLNGHVITMFWAAEIVILLWLWNKSGIKVFHIGFLMITILTLISYFMDAAYNYKSYEDLSIIFNRVFITGIVVVASLVISKFILSKSNQEQQGIIDLHILKRGLNLAIILMAYLVPFFEIGFHLFNSKLDNIQGFSAMNLASYTVIYIAVLAFIYKKNISTSRVLYGLSGTIVLYTLLALPNMISARGNIFNYSHTYEHSLFLTHYLSLPALACIYYFLISNLKSLSRKAFIFVSWVLVILSVIILSVELDNTIVQIGGTAENYHDLLFDVHTFGYPILWGILAMILMVWGQRRKEVLLRQISLAFFAFIILKFYISDIWLMSQTGRIVSFVALGIILLLASFLIQKIKILIKEDKEDNEIQNKD